VIVSIFFATKSDALDSREMISVIENLFDDGKYRKVISHLKMGIIMYGEKAMSEVLFLHVESLRLIVKTRLEKTDRLCQNRKFSAALDELQSLLLCLRLHDYVPPKEFYEQRTKATSGYWSQRRKGA